MTYELNSRTRTAKLMNGKSRKGRVMVPNTIKHKAGRYKVTEIGDRAFYLCHNLQNINIPTSIVSIGNEAFEDCYKLDDIDLPDSIQKIGEEAFFCCKELKSIVIPNDISSIDEKE